MFTKALQLICAIAFRITYRFDKLKILRPILLGLAMDADDRPLSVLDWVELTPDLKRSLEANNASVSAHESGVFVSADDGFLQDLDRVRVLAFHLGQSLGVSTLTIKSPSKRIVFAMKGANTQLVCLE